jgi:hypothetical protein
MAVLTLVHNITFKIDVLRAAKNDLMFYAIQDAAVGD